MNRENDLIAAAKRVLEDDTTPVSELIEQEIIEEQAIEQMPAVSTVEGTLAGHPTTLMVYDVPENAVPVPFEPTTSFPTSNVTEYQKFGDIPTHLREENAINLQEIKKLNLASTIEALEKALEAQQNFPSPDAAFAVASLSEQVLKLTRDLEKNMDPAVILDQIVGGAMSDLTQEIVQDLAGEMKRFRDQALKMVRDEKKEAFDVAFKEAVNRMGPAMKERLEVTKNRVAKILNVKKSRGS
jgi:hypothetical protein